LYTISPGIFQRDCCIEVFYFKNQQFIAVITIITSISIINFSASYRCFPVLLFWLLSLFLERFSLLLCFPKDNNAVAVALFLFLSSPSLVSFIEVGF
jgi:hypothetical protein